MRRRGREEKGRGGRMRREDELFVGRGVKVKLSGVDVCGEME